MSDSLPPEAPVSRDRFAMHTRTASRLCWSHLHNRSVQHWSQKRLRIVGRPRLLRASVHPCCPHLQNPAPSARASSLTHLGSPPGTQAKKLGPRTFGRPLQSSTSLSSWSCSTVISVSKTSSDWTTLLSSVREIVLPTSSCHTSCPRLLPLQCPCCCFSVLLSFHIGSSSEIDRVWPEPRVS